MRIVTTAQLTMSSDILGVALVPPAGGGVGGADEAAASARKISAAGGFPCYFEAVSILYSVAAVEALSTLNARNRPARSGSVASAGVFLVGVE